MYKASCHKLLTSCLILLSFLSHAPFLSLQLGECVIADINILICLNTHFFKKLGRVLVNVFADVTPEEAEHCM